MRQSNLATPSRGKASRLINELANSDKSIYVLRYGKPTAVLISYERCERLIHEGIDPSEH